MPTTETRRPTFDRPAKLPMIMRPNGRLYRPRKIVAEIYTDYHNEEFGGVIVFGTHDIERARPLAEPIIHSEVGPVDITEHLDWIHDGMSGGERRFMRDERRGRACVRFDCGAGGWE